MKYLFFFMIVFIGSLVFLEPNSPFPTEDGMELEAGCELLVKGKPPQVITFERSEKKSGVEEAVWLRVWLF